MTDVTHDTYTGVQLHPRDCRAAIELGRSSVGAGVEIDPMFEDGAGYDGRLGLVTQKAGWRLAR